MLQRRTEDARGVLLWQREQREGARQLRKERDGRAHESHAKWSDSPAISIFLA